MKEETREFAGWLHQRCQTGIVIRVSMFYTDTSLRNLLRSDIRLVAGTEKDRVGSMEAHLLQPWDGSIAPPENLYPLQIAGYWEETGEIAFLEKTDLQVNIKVAGRSITTYEKNWQALDEITRLGGFMEACWEGEDGIQKLFLNRLAGFKEHFNRRRKEQHQALRDLLDGF